MRRLCAVQFDPCNSFGPDQCYCSRQESYTWPGSLTPLPNVADFNRTCPGFGRWHGKIRSEFWKDQVFRTPLLLLMRFFRVYPTGQYQFHYSEMPKSYKFVGRRRQRLYVEQCDPKNLSSLRGLVETQLKPCRVKNSDVQRLRVGRSFRYCPTGPH